MRAEQLTKPACRLRSDGARGSAAARVLISAMLVAHTLSRLSPLGVIVWQGRQHEPLLDHKVVLALPIPEGEEVP